MDREPPFNGLLLGDRRVLGKQVYAEGGAQRGALVRDRQLAVHLSFLRTLLLGSLAACVGCGAATAERASSDGPASQELRPALLPGCAPYEEILYSLEMVQSLMAGTTGGPSSPEDAAAEGAPRSHRDIVPEPLRARAVILQRWATEARRSSAVDSPWGAPSSAVADRFSALALAALALADAAEKQDEEARASARTSVLEKLEDLDPLVASARRCFEPADARGRGSRSLSERLPPALIQATVRSRFGGLRACYEAGLRRNTALAGRVAVRFVIRRDGKVAWAVNEGSDLPDRQVVGCVVTQFAGLAFPPPTGGIVTVVYPIHFSPGDGPTPQGQP